MEELFFKQIWAIVLSMLMNQIGEKIASKSAIAANSFKFTGGTSNSCEYRVFVFSEVFVCLNQNIEGFG